MTENSDSAQSASIGSPHLVERTYAAYREYVVHEDELINQRLTLLIASQSLLLAAYGYVLQKMVESMPPFKALPMGDNCTLLSEYQIGVIFWLVTIVALGGALAYLSLLSLLAAKRAIAEIKERWQIVAYRLDPEAMTFRVISKKRSFTVADWEHVYLPALTGGGDKKAHRWGLHMPHMLPIVFMIMWLIVSGLTFGLGVQRGLLRCPKGPPQWVHNQATPFNFGVAP